jgi:isocitrate/isopropylmalate dehydrogenase
MREHRIAAIPEDGIGTGVIAAGVEFLRELARIDGGFRLPFEHSRWGSGFYLANGHNIPQGGLERLKTFDAIYFGAVGSLDVPDHVSLRGPAAADLPGLRPLRERPTRARPARPEQRAREPRRHRRGDHPREPRG